MEQLLKIVEAVLKPIFYAVYVTSESGLTPRWGTIIFYLFVIILILGSGFAAATISEDKGRSRFIHFILGLLLPVIYPVIIFFTLSEAHEIIVQDEDIDPETGEPIVRKVRLQGEAGERAAQAALEAKQAAETDFEADVIEEEEEEGAINQRYISSLSVDSDGNPQGPFILELNDGSDLEVLQISNPLPTLAVFELQSQDGRSRTIRIPYEKIISCTLKE